MAEDLGNLTLRVTGDVSGATAALRTASAEMDSLAENSAEANRSMVRSARTAEQEIRSVATEGRSIFAGFGDGIRQLESQTVTSAASMGLAFVAFKGQVFAVEKAMESASNHVGLLVRAGLRLAAPLVPIAAQLSGIASIVAVASAAHSRTATIAQMPDADRPDAYEYFGLGRMRSASEETIALARQATSEWEQSRQTVSGFADDIKGFFSDLGVPRILNRVAAEIDATFAAGFRGITQGARTAVDSVAQLMVTGTMGRMRTDDTPTIGTRAITRAELEAESAVNSQRERLDELAEVRAIANERRRMAGGFGNASRGELHAVQQELTLVNQLRKQREDLAERMEAQGTAETTRTAFLQRLEITHQEQIARLRGTIAEDAASTARAELDSIFERSRSEDTLRERAVQFGLVRANASRAEVESVRDLVEAYTRARGAGGNWQAATGQDWDGNAVSGGPNVDLIMAQEEARQRRRAAGEQTAANAEEQLRFQMLVRSGRQQGLNAEMALAAARETLAIESGVSRFDAARTRSAEERLSLLNRAQAVTESLQSPLQRAEEAAQELLTLRDRGLITGRQSNIGIGQQFQQLVAGLGSGPSSFGLSGSSSRSREGLLRADDFRVRSEINNSENRVPNLLEAIRRQNEIRERNAERNGERVVQAIADAAMGRWR